MLSRLSCDAAREASSVFTGGVDNAVQEALLNFIGKPTRELEQVDLGSKLASLGLDRIFPVEVRRVCCVVVPVCGSRSLTRRCGPRPMPCAS